MVDWLCVQYYAMMHGYFVCMLHILAAGTGTYLERVIKCIPHCIKICYILLMGLSREIRIYEKSLDLDLEV
jgi:hypothetical protein